MDSKLTELRNRILVNKEYVSPDELKKYPELLEANEKNVKIGSEHQVVSNSKQSESDTDKSGDLKQRIREAIEGLEVMLELTEAEQKGQDTINTPAIRELNSIIDSEKNSDLRHIVTFEKIPLALIERSKQGVPTEIIGMAQALGTCYDIADIESVTGCVTYKIICDFYGIGLRYITMELISINATIEYSVERDYTNQYPNLTYPPEFSFDDNGKHKGRIEVDINEHSVGWSLYCECGIGEHRIPFHPNLLEINIRDKQVTLYAAEFGDF